MSQLELVQEINVMTASADTALGWALNVNSGSVLVRSPRL